jgi:hypothetical protein
LKRIKLLVVKVKIDLFLYLFKPQTIKRYVSVKFRVFLTSALSRSKY